MTRARAPKKMSAWWYAVFLIGGAIIFFPLGIILCILLFIQRSNWEDNYGR